jgi:mannose-6-phosphate isomerase-like protein (cupin superfamily)
VFILLEGRARYTAGDQVIELEAGNVLIVPPDTPHCYENIGTAPLRQVSVHERGVMVQRTVT